jgi:hypothetical protein
MRDTFTDPLTGATYPWLIGHDTEDSAGKQRQIQESANTANTGLVKQQGDTTPVILKYSGKILHLSQLQQFWKWFELCETQTIYFSDYAGDTYEVIITDFSPVRKATVRNPKDFANAPFWYWTYSISMEVIRVISGSMAGVTP